MTRAFLGLRIANCLFCLTAAAVVTAAAVELDPNPGALMQAMQGHGTVLLGEVHDNAVQHALRAAASNSADQPSIPTCIASPRDRFAATIGRLYSSARATNGR